MIRQKIYIASDHAGYALKEQICEYLKEEELDFEDLGCKDQQSCDYPVYAKILCKKMDKEKDFGVLVCGSGIGISIAANRFKGVRAALCSEPFSAQLARLHNDANVLALGGRLLGKDMALKVLKVFISTQFEGSRHQRRIDLIERSLDDL